VCLFLISSCGLCWVIDVECSVEVPLGVRERTAPELVVGDPAMITTPKTTSCQKSETFRSRRRLRSAPTAARRSGPDHGSLTAEQARSADHRRGDRVEVVVRPRDGSPVTTRLATMTPPSPASSPWMTYTEVSTRLTRIPDSRAVS